MEHSIRTFHARRGRLGPRAASALQDLLPRYGLDPVGPPLDFDDEFPGPLPVVVEFGSGMGEATAAMAKAEPGVGIIAVEVHTPGVSSLLRRIETERLDNVRVVHGDGIALLDRRIPAGSLAGFRSFFPDPWPKARHHKRRLIRTELVRLIASRLQTGATLHVATDWDDYAEQMLAVLAAEPMLSVHRDTSIPRPLDRPVTRFERKGLEQGHTVHDIVAVRVAA